MLILYQLVLSYSVEGMENDPTYKEYDPDNTMILAQQNAGNIKVLKQQVDGVMGLEKQVTDLSDNVVTLQQQVEGIILAQQDYAQQNIPSEPADISGVEESADV
jgi:hypothetical protein